MSKGWRYERKFRVERLAEPLLRQLIRTHPLSFSPAYPDRLIGNVYFDTPGFQCFEENVAGIAQRKKYRLRWYQDKWDAAPRGYRLEVKEKSNQVGCKEVTRLAGMPSQLNELWNPKQGKLQPSLLNAYRRSYFLSGCGRFRVTLDRELFFAHPPARLSNRMLSRFRFQKEDPAFILELKYDQSIDIDVEEVTHYLPLRQTRNSKYVQGVELIYGGVA